MSILNKLIKKIKKKIYGDKYILSTYKGLQLLLRATNHVDRMLLWDGHYEEEQITRTIKLINENEVGYFVDVGANIGVYSLRVAKSSDRLEKIISIEAQIENYNQLCANIRLNDFDRLIEAKHIGVSNKFGKLEFLVNKGSSTGTSRIKDTAPTGTKLRKFNSDLIIVDRLDKILYGLKNKSLFFKIDVEGHEKLVLEGMEQLIKSNHCFFQIEILDDSHQAICKDYALIEIGRVGRDFYFESKHKGI